MTTDQLRQAWQAGQIVGLAGPAKRDQQALQAVVTRAGLQALQGCWGPGVVLGSGGSTGERRWCLQPLTHLLASADATGRWLEGVGVDPAACLHLNPLPHHHVSGLMPWLRAWRWGAVHQTLEPAWLRTPHLLADAVPLKPHRPAVLSLVPTQLQRLMADPDGLHWLRQLAVIWVGGGPLPSRAAAQARHVGLRLAPCYGATETAAMVCALDPESFLAGGSGCGLPLADVQLRLDPFTAAVEVGTDRLSPGWLKAGELQPFPEARAGWWRSGDAGCLDDGGLQVLGRLDGAVISGGETVFPEQLELRLLAAAREQGLPLQAVLLLAVEDGEWGHRLVALVRLEPAVLEGCGLSDLLRACSDLCNGWAPAERPRRWCSCPELAPSALGKWQRGRWRAWFDELEAVM